MAGSPLDAIAYLKAQVPSDDPAPSLQLNEDESPVLKTLGGDLLVSYVLDEGNKFSYVQAKHLRAAGITADDLHQTAVENLRKAAQGRVTLREYGAIKGLFFDGNFEASLILLDELWDVTLRDYHGGEPVIAVPARDILCFSKSSSAAGIAEMRAAIERVWPTGNHLISRELFLRRGQQWVAYESG